MQETPEDIVRKAIEGLREVAKNAGDANDHTTVIAAQSEIVKAAYWLRDKNK